MLLNSLPDLLRTRKSLQACHSLQVQMSLWLLLATFSIEQSPFVIIELEPQMSKHVPLTASPILPTEHLVRHCICSSEVQSNVNVRTNKGINYIYLHISARAFTWPRSILHFLHSQCSWMCTRPEAVPCWRVEMRSSRRPTPIRSPRSPLRSLDTMESLDRSGAGGGSY